jgi:pilus assembly protein Flp/PilA
MTRRPVLRALLRDEGGATAIEYGLIVALMTLALLAGLTQLSDENTGLWSGSGNKINAAVTAALSR